MKENKENQLTIAIVDNHLLFGEATSFLLSSTEPSWSVSVYKSAPDFLAQNVDTMPDIIISEIAMKEMNGIDFIKEIKKSRKKTSIIILSYVTESKTIRISIRYGASGYLSKNASAAELIKAIHMVYEGDSYIGESLRKRLVTSTLTENTINYNLSPREKEVLQYICAGKTIKETGVQMNLSANTIQTYYRTIMKKFNLNRVTDLIV